MLKLVNMCESTLPGPYPTVTFMVNHLQYGRVYESTGHIHQPGHRSSLRGHFINHHRPRSLGEVSKRVVTRVVPAEGLAAPEGM